MVSGCLGNGVAGHGLSRDLRKEVATLGIGLIGAWAIAGVALHEEKDLEAAWNELSGKSNSYGLLVDAYRDCRGTVLLGDSYAECVITVSEYANARGLGNDFENFLMDLDETRSRIKEGL